QMKTHRLFSWLRTISFLIAAFTFGSTVSRGAVEVTEFGKMPDGAVVKLFTLRNASGMTVKVINYGAIVTEIQAPDRTGAMTSVLLGTNNLAAYSKGFPAAAAVIGRVANRIAKARFTLDGVEYKLAANSAENHIHGGRVGFARVLWEAKAF